MDGEKIKFPANRNGAQPTRGTAGIKSQVPGAAATVSGLVRATGGMRRGSLVGRDIK